jgi:hypothetical protein
MKNRAQTTKAIATSRSLANQFVEGWRQHYADCVDFSRRLSSSQEDPKELLKGAAELTLGFYAASWGWLYRGGGPGASRRSSAVPPKPRAADVKGTGQHAFAQGFEQCVQGFRPVAEHWFDGIKAHVNACFDLAERASCDTEYSHSDLCKDAIDLSVNAVSVFLGCAPCQPTLDFDHQAEMSGPQTFFVPGLVGVPVPLGDLVLQGNSAVRIPAAHITIRVPEATRLVVSLTNLLPLQAALVDGVYVGALKLPNGSTFTLQAERRACR